MRLSEWNNRPIANNGVSLEDIKTIIHNIITREILQWQIGRKELEIAVSNMIRSYLLDNGKKDLAKAIIAKLPTTAPQGGVEEIKHADNCPSVKGAPVCTCEHLRRYS
jgi:hypothetical protein